MNPLLATRSGTLSVPTLCGALEVRRSTYRGDHGASTSDTLLLRAFGPSLGNSKAREALVAHARRLLHRAPSVTIALDGPGVKDAFLVVSSKEPTGRLLVQVDGDISGIAHPFAGLLPGLMGEALYADTRWHEDARAIYVAPDLQGPLLWDKRHRPAMSETDSLVRYLGRTVVPGRTVNGIGRRLVEPGVGRSCLVDFLALTGANAAVDFTASGIGLTPYSARGFVDIGRHLDGRIALKRAEHRRRVADRLEALGCRASRVVAIVKVPPLRVTMLDDSHSPAVVMVRAFRCVLRVKQLDPVGSFYHSVQHGATLGALLLEEATREADRTLGAWTADTMRRVSRVGHELSLLGPAADDFARLVETTGHGDGGQELRQRLLRRYAPSLFRLARRRISRELGRGRPSDCLSTESYVLWFAQSLGKQLARMRLARFLHDYHHPGVSRYHPSWLYTLVEHNVTLAAEFADLETSVFVDDPTGSIQDTLQLSSRDVATLRDGYESFHQEDWAMARRVVRSLAAAAVCARESTDALLERAVAEYEAAYCNGTASV